MKKIIRYIFLGILAFIPLFIVVQVVIYVNKMSLDLFVWVSKYTNNELYSGIIIVTTILILAIIGYTTEKFGRSVVILLIDKILDKIPAISTIYTVVKKITKLFMPSSGDDKKEVVLVEYPKKDLWVPAYVLSKYKDLIVLFIPTSPNPTSGYTVIVKKDMVRSVDLSVGEASQFIVSMGADFVKKEKIYEVINNTN